MSPKTTPMGAAEQADSLTTKLDRELAGRAYRKVTAGETPTGQERAALRRYEKAQEEQRRWQYYRSVPQRHWRDMSGRQAKVLREQADRYGIPFDGATIDLPKVVRALHDFLARNAHKLNQGEDDYLIGESSPALERYREERAKIAKLDRLQREGTLADVRELHDGLLRMASIIRSAGESLQRIYGPEAADLLNEAIDEATEHLDEFFSDKSVLDRYPD